MESNELANPTFPLALWDRLANQLHELAISISTRFDNFFTYTYYYLLHTTRTHRATYTFTHIAVRVCPDILPVCPTC